MMKETEESKKSKNKRQRYIIYPIVVIALVVIGFFLKPYISFDAAKDSSSGWENSIAVLPFDNISNDPEQEYFCDGMTEQIITNLSRIKRLKVIARTSVRMYKNTNKQIPEIGKELNVV